MQPSCAEETLKKHTDILDVFVSEISVSAMKQINTIQVLGETFHNKYCNILKSRLLKILSLVF